MRLTSFTDYGMRMASAPDRAVSTAEIADEFGQLREHLSKIQLREHLSKIMHRLAQGGIVATRRGGGGRGCAGPRAGGRNCGLRGAPAGGRPSVSQMFRNHGGATARSSFAAG